MSKKFLFFLSLSLVAIGVSACSSSNTQTPGNSPADQSAPNSPSVPPSASVSNSLNNNSAAPAAATAPAATSAPAADQAAAPAVAPVQNITTMPAPDKQADLTKEYSQALVKTNFGDITLKFYGTDAPMTVNNFLNLAQAGFYNGTKFHRIIKGFMIQGGDPLTKGSDTSLYGTGGPGYQFKDEYNNYPLDAGTLAMANSGPNTNGSQFFIVTSPTALNLQGHYTIFGHVVSGMDTVTKIENVAVTANPGNPGEQSFPTQDVIINSIELLK